MLYKNRKVDLPEGAYKKQLPLVSYRQVGQSFGNRYTYYFPRRMNGSNSNYSYYYGTTTGPHFINAHSFQYQWQMYSGPTAPEGTVNPDVYKRQILQWDRKMEPNW